MWIWLGIPVLLGICAGFLLGRYPPFKKRHRPRPQALASKEYLVGLNYLLNEETDKAVDIFIRLLEVDANTVETHLALGNLFRRRGEVDKAIRIHQNLIARPHLEKQSRVQALLALAQDYLKAGVFDRAEKLFLEVSTFPAFKKDSLHFLLTIYEQEKAWESAINIAEQLEQLKDEPINFMIAQYYCELAVEARVNISGEKAIRLVKKALSIDKNCVRASILLGQWDAEQGQYRTAVKSYKLILEQNSDFITEVLAPLETCYKQLNLLDEYILFLEEVLIKTPRISIVLMLSKYIEQSKGIQAAANFVAEQLHERPSIRGLERLIALQKDFTEGNAKFHLQLLQDLTAQIIKNKPVYQCSACGNTGKLLHWQCPACKRWNTVKPIYGIEGA
jgi:lipopolysaccharide assembly protein B